MSEGHGHGSGLEEEMRLWLDFLSPGLSSSIQEPELSLCLITKPALCSPGEARKNPTLQVGTPALLERSQLRASPCES